MSRDIDELDCAATLTQEMTDREITRVRQEAAKIDISNSSGECWYCGEPTGNDRRWCDRDCADMWEKENV